MHSSMSQEIRRRFAILLIGFVMLWPAGLSAQAQPEGEKASEEAVPRVAVGEITGSPGASLMIPLYFTPDPKTPLRSIVVDIDYVSNNLKFHKAARGTAAEQAGAEISANLTDGAPDENGLIRSTLRVSASLAEETSKTGLPAGLLAFLMFDVSMDAKAFSIRLNTTVVSAEDLRDPPQVAKVNAVPGMVVVEIPDLMPEATCFFFTH